MTSGTIDDLPAVLTPAMVCSYLAIETTRPDRWVHARRRDGLRCLKLGRVLRVMRADLLVYLDRCASAGEGSVDRRKG